MTNTKFMDKSDLNQFIKNTEKTVLPSKVGPLYPWAERLGRLPKKWQKFFIERGSKNDPFIGFVVEPYSFFISFEITDLQLAQTKLPLGYELAACSMFEGGEPKHCAIFSVFNVRSSVFWGNRLELNLIARSTKTGRLSWVIADYESNTISFDPGQGFSGSTTKHSVVTTSYKGEVIIDIESHTSGNKIALVADLQAAKQRPLNRPLWVDGNLAVDYGGDLEEDSPPFALIFDPDEMNQALNIPPDQIELEHNTFSSEMLKPEPFEALYFPYTKHFLTTSFPIVSTLENEKDLITAVQKYNEKSK
ncbi:MAG: hypothetical protein AAGD96_19000 [Chloroflexota bacterium]